MCYIQILHYLRNQPLTVKVTCHKLCVPFRCVLEKNTLWWFLMQRRENELYIPYRVTHVTYEISFLVEMIINCHAFIFVVSGIKVCHASGWDP